MNARQPPPPSGGDGGEAADDGGGGGSGDGGDAARRVPIWTTLQSASRGSVCWPRDVPTGTRETRMDGQR